MQTEIRTQPGTPHPIHAILLGFPIALFTTATITDVAYLRTAEIQWTNFSAWLITGGLFFGGLVLAWALIALVLRLRSSFHLMSLLYPALLAVMWVLGLINIFKHSQDGWSSVGAFGLILSVLCALLALAAGFVAYSGLAEREVAR